MTSQSSFISLSNKSKMARRPRINSSLPWKTDIEVSALQYGVMTAASKILENKSERKFQSILAFKLAACTVTDQFELKHTRGLDLDDDSSFVLSL